MTLHRNFDWEVMTLQRGLNFYSLWWMFFFSMVTFFFGYFQWLLFFCGIGMIMNIVWCACIVEGTKELFKSVRFNYFLIGLLLFRSRLSPLFLHYNQYLSTVQVWYWSFTWLDYYYKINRSRMMTLWQFINRQIQLDLWRLFNLYRHESSL